MIMTLLSTCTALCYFFEKSFYKLVFLLLNMQSLYEYWDSNGWCKFVDLSIYKITQNHAAAVRPFIIICSSSKWQQESKRWGAVVIWLFSEVLFHLISFAYWWIKFLLSIFFLTIAILMFFSVMTNNQIKCSIIFKNIVMRMMNKWLIMNDLS